MGARYTLDGAPVDIVEFILDNGFDDETTGQVMALKVGESMTFGGGAWATFVLKREADDATKPERLTPDRRAFLLAVGRGVARG